jgi:tRNA-splicing ligase RtcB
MNNRQLEKIGVPSECLNAATQLVQAIAKYNRTVVKDQRVDIEAAIKYCVDKPYVVITENSTGTVGNRMSEQLGLHQEFVGLYGKVVEPMASLAKAIIDDRDFVRATAISYKTWGAENIDQGSHEQMKQACSMPNALGAALMPDAHVGYGLPIGGVLGLQDAVCPYAVGVDIACRMKLSIFPLNPDELNTRRPLFRSALERGTVFGVGGTHERPQDHAVMDQDWEVTRITRERKDTAWKQLGTSGSGNHFAEFGVLTFAEDANDLGVKAGEYIALMTHSGSRGAGAAVCQVYSSIAQGKLPKKYADLGRLAWLDMDTQEGQEYWAAMNLMGDYAAANHDVIHKLVSKLLGEKPIAGIENHHNFAWEEIHNGKKMYVHRKGATPAGEGVLGVIPGSMADPAYVVRGKGNPESLCSASHGAGRAMSRTKAKEIFNWTSTKNNLAARGIEVISAGADEVPGVYKNIDDVMAQQTDLVDKVAKFQPILVKMCGTNDKAED